MKKRVLSLCLALALCVGLMPAAWAATTTQAVRNTSKIYLDGVELQLAAYTINQSNYFKLRDLAYVLSGTSKQFDVSWDNARGAVEIHPGRAYTPNGQEMTSVDQAGTASPSLGTFLYNGSEIRLTAYQIGGNNFVKLRDVGQLLDFSVEWNAAASSIAVDSSKGYTQEANKVLSQTAKDALAEMTYYGDRSKCAMSQAQMAAYAHRVVTFSDADTSLDEVNVFLADFEDNGNPYLVIVHPAPGFGQYAPAVFSYVNGEVQWVCDCYSGSASAASLSKLKDGRVLYSESESDGDSWQSMGSYVLFDGGLAEIPKPGEDQTVYDETFYRLCYPGLEKNPNCQDGNEAARSLEAAAGVTPSESSQAARAMLAVLEEKSEYLLQAKLVDLNGDGVQELFVLTGEGTLYTWQNGALQSKSLGVYAGGSLSWYLFRDAVTGEMGIEYSAGGGEYSDHWYVYLSHTTELGEYGLENTTPYINGVEVSQAEYDAEVARHVRLECIGGDMCTVDSVEETLGALYAML